MDKNHIKYMLDNDQCCQSDLKVILQPENEELLKEHGWEVIHLIINGSVAKELAIRTLEKIANVASGKEVVLGLHNAIEKTMSLEHVFILLKCYNQLMLRWINNNLMIEKELLQEFQQRFGILFIKTNDKEANEESAYDANDSEHQIEKRENEVWNIICWITRHVARLEKLDIKVDRNIKCGLSYLQSFYFQSLFGLLDLPIIYLNLDCDFEDCRISIEIIMDRHLKNDLINLIMLLRERLLEKRSLPSFIESVGNNPKYGINLACLCFIVICRPHRIDYLPSVVSHIYLLQIIIHPLMTLLANHRKSNQHTMKGLELCNTCFSRLETKSISQLSWNKFHVNFVQLIQRLLEICSHCSNENSRKLSKETMDLVLSKIEIVDRFKFLRLLAGALTDPQHCGFIIDQGRLTLHACLQGSSCSISDDSLTKWCQLICETNVYHTELTCLHESSRLLAGLNFIRYLFIQTSMTLEKRIWQSCQSFLASVEKYIVRDIKMCESIALEDLNPSIMDVEGIDLKQSNTAMVTLQLLKDVHSRVMELTKKNIKDDTV